MNSKNERYYYYKSKGICVMCGCQDSMINLTVCYDCNEKRNESQRKHRNKNVEKCKEREKKSHKELREKRIKEGKCVRCGSEKEEDKYKTCKKCRHKRKQIYLKNEIKSSIPKRSLRDYIESCSICGDNERVKGKKVCKKCYDRLLKSASHARKFIDTENHKWRKDEEISFKEFKYKEVK